MCFVACERLYTVAQHEISDSENFLLMFTRENTRGSDYLTGNQKARSKSLNVRQIIAIKSPKYCGKRCWYIELMLRNTEKYIKYRSA